MILNLKVNYGMEDIFLSSMSYFFTVIKTEQEIMVITPFIVGWSQVEETSEK